MKRGSWSILSAMMGGGSILSALNGDNIMSWVMLFCNAAILVVNCAVEVYRKWRDRDKDLKNKSEGKENNDK